MAELDIDASYGLFARWLQPINSNPGRNLFDPAARTELASDPGVAAGTGRLGELRTAGIVADDTDGFTLAPLRGLLVLPGNPPQGGTPVALIMHGMSPTFEPSGAAAANEVHSYRGYRYFQQHLAASGIASLSIAANVVNRFATPGGDDDYQRRAQLFLLHFALLSALAAAAAPGRTPLRCNLPRGMVPLDTALSQPASQPTASRGPDVLLRELVQRVQAASLDLTRIAVMGHSRGATAVAEFAQRVQASTSTPSGTPSGVVEVQRANVEGLIRTLGAPGPAHIKALIPLEPDDIGPYPLGLPDTFLLAMAGSHDEDVSSSAANIYEGATCPKALLVMHGATHGRFNTVWRTLRHTKHVINKSIECQTSLGQPIRIMSNASHEEVLKAFAGACLTGRLLGRPDDLLIFTSERRGPRGTDVTRCWRFPAGTVSLDSGINAPTAVLQDIWIGDWHPYAQTGTVFRITRPARQPSSLTVPIADGQLDGMTHLSVRVAKEHNGQSTRARAAEPLRNFDLGLFTDTGLQIGRSIPGSAVPSLLQPVYPTRKWTDQDGEVCYDDTRIFLQTVEVRLTQFLAGTRFTASDLSRVRELRFGMLPAAKSGDDTFCLVDFVLSAR